MNDISDNNELVSIIMPNFNGGKFLKQSIDSVRNQTYPNWELIIVDDFSTDESMSIINEYLPKDSRVQSYRLNNNSGTPGAPRNLAIDKAGGDYIAFLDSDDIWHPQKLEIQLKLMANYNSKFTFTDVLPFSNESVIKPYLLENFSLNEDLINKRVDYNYLLRKNFIKSCSTAILRFDIIKDNRFNDDPKFRAVEDYMFWLDILKTNCEYANWVSLATTFYRESASSISKSKLFMVKQNYKMYNYLFKDQKQKKLMVICKMFTYAFYSIIQITKQKKPSLN